MTRSIAVVGAGIAGLATAHHLASSGSFDVTIFERAHRVGGRVKTSPFAGVAHVDEAADAFLIRVPDALDLAEAVGLGEDLVHPEPVGAAIWYNGLHDLPDGLLLGVPAKIGPLARSGLLSWRGKLRAAAEPLLPRSSIDHDSIGRFVRSRFGDEVHERLVDALVGSIYATDTDHFSLTEVPQLASLATSGRSVMYSAYRTRRRANRQSAGTSTGNGQPIFAAPREGIGALTDATAAAAIAAGATLRLGAEIDSIESASGRWRIEDQPFDHVVLATPARATAKLIGSAAPQAAAALATAESSDVIMVRLHIDQREWPERLNGRSGYLVPKPVQRSVTAVSFGSQKWAHWQPPDGGQILRASLGSGGVGISESGLKENLVIEQTLDDLKLHLGRQFSPLEVSISHWPHAFAQYRPHHARWANSVESALPKGLWLVGSSLYGIGLPSCIHRARTIGLQLEKRGSDLPQSPTHEREN